MRFLAVWLGCSLFGVTLADAAAPLSPEEAAEFLQMALDAQLTREAQWKQGSLTASVEQTGVDAMSAELTLVWEGERAFLEVRRLREQSMSATGRMQEYDSNPFRKCISPSEEWAYFPTIPVVLGWGGDKLRGIPSAIDVAPLQAWGTVPFIRQIRLSDSMGRSITSGKLSGERLDNGLVRITTGTRVYVIDPAHDGDVVRIENDLTERPPEVAKLASPHIFVATYEWHRDGQGVPYCRTYRAELFQEEDPADSVYIREVNVTDYTSVPATEQKRFDLDALAVPKGTRAEYLGSNSMTKRIWRYGVRGSEAEGLQQPDFDRLIEQMKQRGFAAPDELE